MKKIVLLILVLVVSAVVVSMAVDTALTPVKPKTANADRIAELTKQLDDINAQISQAQQFIDAKKVEGLKIVGAVEELQRQDAAAAEKAKPTVKPTEKKTN